MQFDGICTAIRTGNVRLFSHHMMESSADFLKLGTYLLMMKLKFMVYRTLCQGVYGLMQKKLGQGSNKLAMEPFAQAMYFQDDCDEDETACIMANLIFAGFIKGYISNEHKKLVFAKDTPFPHPSKWRT